MKGIRTIALLCVAAAASALFAQESENLLTNGSFESGVTGWSFAPNTTDGAAATRIIDSVSLTAKEGTKFCRINVTAISDQNWHVQMKDPTWQAQMGYIYHFSMWARSSAERSATISVYGGPNSNDEYRTGTAISLTTEWKQFHQMFISDAEGMGKINFAVVMGSDTGTYDIDDVVITGVANPDNELYPNGGFEADGATWTLNMNTAEGATGAATISFPSSGAHSGDKYCSVNVTALPAESWEIQLSDGSWECVDGGNYIYSFFAKASEEGAVVQVAAHAGSSRDYEYLDGESFTLTTAWAAYEYPYTPTGIAGPDSLTFNMYCGGALGTYDFDDISLKLTGVSVDCPKVAMKRSAAPLTIRALPSELRCSMNAATPASRVMIHDLRGRVFYSATMAGLDGADFSLPKPPSGMWIVRINRQSSSVMVP